MNGKSDIFDIANTPVAILAGGLATRLRPLTERIPKALINIAGLPFAEHQLRLLQRQGIKRAVFCVGFLGEQVRDTLGDGRRWDMRLEYSFDGATLLGTGGALKRALPLLGESFFVMYGDSYLECDFAPIWLAFKNSGKLALMTVFHNKNKWETSNILFKSGQILVYEKQKRTPDMRHVDYGLGVFRSEALNDYPEDKALDLENVYKGLLLKGQLASYEVTSRFYEIGSPSGLEETRKYLAKSAR